MQAGVGRLPTRSLWVLGMLDVQYSPPRPVLQVVCDRTAQTLCAVVENTVIHGSTVVTDGWRSYAGLAASYNHRTVNHGVNFVNPATGS